MLHKESVIVFFQVINHNVLTIRLKFVTLHPEKIESEHCGISHTLA